MQMECQAVVQTDCLLTMTRSFLPRRDFRTGAYQPSWIAPILVLPHPVAGDAYR
jgi:hypothetical protein